MTDVLLPGKRLQNARNAKAMSEQEVARQLHLSVTVVKALESDDYDRLPEPAFVKGYIRNYARLVGIPADEVANLYQEIAAEEQSVAVPVSSLEDDAGSQQSWWLYGLAALLVLVFVGFWYAGDDQSAPQVNALPEPVLQGEQAGPKPVPAESSEQIAQVPREESTEVSVDAGAPDAAEVVSQVPAPAPQPKQDDLSMTFSDACWVRVVDAQGNEVYSGQRAAGASLAVQGEGPFRITLGNAAAVSEININGTVVPVPVSTPGRVVTVRTP